GVVGGPAGHERDRAAPVSGALEGAAAARRASPRAHVHRVRIAGMYRDVPALSGARGIAVAPRDPAVLRGAGDTHARVVLLRAVDAIGVLIVDRQVVELRGELVVDV